MNNLFSKIALWVLVAILPLIFIQHCEAPRNNPLDPANPRTSVSQISGQVLSAQVPTNPVSNVNVYWDIDKVYTTTNAKGEFSLINITPQNGNLRFVKSGFLSDTLQVIWKGASNAQSFSINLNAAPQLANLKVYTVVKNLQGDISPQTELVVKAQISDSDNDIDHVYIRNDYLNLNHKLKYNLNDQVYQESFNYPDLPLLQKNIGHKLDVYVKDRSNHTICVGGDKAVRIITDKFSLVYPSSYQTISPDSLKLKWNKYNPGFNYTWAVEIYVDDKPAYVVWDKYDLAANDTCCIVDQYLADKDYFWMVWCIDEFQNRARSKPISFTIKE